MIDNIIISVLVRFVKCISIICRIYNQKVEFPDGHLACYEFVKVQEDSCFLLSK